MVPAHVPTVSVGQVMDFFGTLAKEVATLRLVQVLSNLEAKDKQPARSFLKVSSSVLDEETGNVRRAMMEAT